MSFAEDMWYDCYDMEDIPWTPEWIDNQYWIIKVIENWFVVKKSYCKNCWSINIKISQKWNKYCWELCWKKFN
jgi:hypothetical protein